MPRKTSSMHNSNSEIGKSFSGSYGDFDEEISSFSLGCAWMLGAKPTRRLSWSKTV